MKQSIKLPLKSIQRNVPPGANEGFCDEFINLRYKNGGFRPVGAKEALYNVPTYDKVYIHKQDNFENWIGFKESTGALDYYNPSTLTVTQSIDTITDVVYDIRTLANFLIVTTDKEALIFLYEDDSYSFISLTDIEQYLSVTLNSNGAEVEVDVESEYGSDAESTLGKYYKLVNEKSKDGLMLGGVTYRFALKLFDGSYVLHTVPKYHQFGKSFGGKLVRSDDGYKFTFDQISSTVATAYISTILDSQLLEKLKPVVTSVVLFFSQVQPFYDISEDSMTDDNFDTWFPSNWPQVFSGIFEVSEGFKDLPDSPAWYKVGEVSIDSFEEGGLISAIYESEFDLDLDGYYQNYATRTTLPIDNYSHHKNTGKASYIYNDRLQLGNTIQTLGPSLISSRNILTPLVYDPIAKTEVEYSIDFGTDIYQGKVITTLRTSNGTKKIVQGISLNCYKNPIVSTKKAVFLEGIVGYWDSRATNMEILIEIGGNYYQIFNQPLTSSIYSNYAYYSAPDFEPTDESDFRSTSPPARYDRNLNAIVVWFNTSLFLQTATVPDENKEVVDNNNIQISEVSNPIVFDVENYQQVGEGSVLAFGTNNDPISDSQFGQFPIYTFCTDGIWALEITVGETYISRVVPVNREVILDRNAKVDISLGSVYASAEGLKVLQGRNAIEISGAVEGIPDQYFTDNTDLQYFLNNSPVVDVSDYVDKVPFKDYLAGAIIGYAKSIDNEEIIVANDDYEYSYVFDLKNKLWYKLGIKISMFIDYYPKLYASRTTTGAEKIIDMTSEIDSNIPCYFHTRPLNVVGEDEAIKLHRTFLRGFLNTPSGSYAAFYIFSSDDLKEWKLVTGNDRNTGSFNNIWCTHSNDSNRYYIYVFASTLVFDEDALNTYIKYIQTEFQRKWTRKLR